MAKSKTATKAKATGRGRKKGEQQHIAGMGPEKNPKVHPVAVEYVRTRDGRMDMLKEEVKLKERLLEAMHGEKLTAYEYDDIHVTIVTNSKEEIKVKRAGKEIE